MRQKPHSAFWRRLDRPGHDAALLRTLADGWLLQGTAAFSHEAGPASVAYEVEVDRQWRTRRGVVRGFLAHSPFDHEILRGADGWRLNGSIVHGLERLVDLDYGFTPATNILQLRRNAAAVGGKISLPVAWFDLESASLMELKQIYERRGEAAYWYVAPTVAYEGLLEIAASDFIKTYPGLWRLEA
jgi:hypothetical protein